MQARGSDVTFDGNWWNSLDLDGQLSAVQRTMAGIQEGFFVGMMRVPGPTMATYTKYAPVFSHTFGYYQSAVTDFYVTHPEAMKADIGAVMDCLGDKPLFSCATLAKKVAGSS